MELVFLSSGKAFEEIYFNEKPVKEIKEEFVKNRAIVRFKKEIVTLTRAMFRYIFLLNEFFDACKKDFTNEELSIISACFVDVHITKLFDAEKTITYIRRKLGKKYKDIKDAFENFNLQKYFDSIEDKYHLYSVKFSIPYWLVKMLAKQYGEDNIEKILDDIKQRGDELFFTYKDLSKDSSYASIGDNLYKAIEPVKKDPAIIPILTPYIAFVDHLIVESYNNTFILIERDINFLNYILERASNPICYYNVALGTNVNPYSVKKMFDSKYLSKYNIFSYKNKYSLDVSLSNKIDLAIVSPITSNLYRAREGLFLLKLKQESIDLYIKRQRTILEHLYSHMDDNSTIVYLTNTINKKENQEIIKDFLSRHNDFVLTNEKTYMPGEYPTCGYVAVLKRQ